jgi:hypothetical protein
MVEEVVRPIEAPRARANWLDPTLTAPAAPAAAAAAAARNAPTKTVDASTVVINLALLLMAASLPG